MSTGFASPSDSREATMDTLIQDLRFALRQLVKSPTFTLVAILTLALGIGANTAVYSVVEGVLLKPLPFPASDQLMYITRSGDVSIPDGVDWRERSRSYSDIALFLRQWAFD